MQAGGEKYVEVRVVSLRADLDAAIDIHLVYVGLVGVEKNLYRPWTV